MGLLSDMIRRYRLRGKRRRLLWRAIRARRRLQPVCDRTAGIAPGDILLFACLRNEAARLPFFLRHYRDLGVSHFLIVDNASTDATAALLRAEPDVSLWRAGDSYRAARFGMDWINGLLMRHGSGHWCLTVDADEILILPTDRTPALPALTAWLDAQGADCMAALMLDLYPRGPLSSARCAPGADPATVLDHYDPCGYDWEYQPRYRNISIRGGPRQRVLFADNPERAPHLHKTPLIRWHWRYAYVSSTHIALPPRLNAGFDARRGLPTGVLLHNKFLDQVIPRSRDEKLRGEHFTHAALYDDYYDRLIADPVLWHPEAATWRGWRALEAEGLISRGGWTPDPAQNVDKTTATN
ncbi:glycosyltransferase family 2 protein [Paenirhodobacter populi]|uniref:glycosyltransferase family 2 protein n=1 Tax=Paenirhodobacter populi TaxID=2306993 RepID=UPI000FE414FF|nr:glycosyltransferase family 2 protein [Sinirhodobacter populi]RWR10194.1 glycosyltransferase family 2 protein [Sinirhodobacter populi]